MGGKINWSKMTPLLEGINSTFDLLGCSSLTKADIEKRNTERKKKNTIEYDFSVVCNYIGEAFVQYGKEEKDPEL